MPREHEPGNLTTPAVGVGEFVEFRDRSNPCGGCDVDVDAGVVELVALLSADAIQVLDGVLWTRVIASVEKRAVVRRAAVGPGCDVGQRALEHPHLGARLVGNVDALFVYRIGDVGPDEQGALVGAPMRGVEVHQLDALHRDACTLDHVCLNCGVGRVLRLHARRGFDLSDDPAIAFLRECVDGDEDVVFNE